MRILIKLERRFITEAEARVNEREQLFVLSCNARYYKRNSRIICTQLITGAHTVAHLYVVHYNER